MDLNPGYDILGKVSEATFHMHMHRRHVNEDFGESFRAKQIICKKWLAEELSRFGTGWGRVLVLGSWNSILLYELMSRYGKIGHWTFVDINPRVHADRDIYFEVNGMQKNYISLEMDATDFSDHESFDLIINCSCEHMKDIPAEYGPLYVLQSNDYTNVKEHINCVKSAKELSEKNNITEVLFGSHLNMGHYKRFMTIGYFV